MIAKTNRPAAEPATTSKRALIVVAVSGIILSLSFGMRQSLGLFLPPLTADLGVSAASFGFAMALQSIVWGLTQPFVGMIGDRYGARPVLVACAAIYAAGLLVMSHAGPAVGLTAGVGGMLGLGISGTGYGVLIGAVARAVRPEQRTRMVGLVAAVGSLATFVIAPLGQFVIAAYGWHVALAVFAGFAVSMGLLATVIGREQAGTASTAATEPAGLSIAAVARVAFAHRGFTAMTVAFFACGFQLMFITTHLAAFLAICGVSSAVSAGAIGILGLCNAAGSYAFGLLGARYSPKRLLSLIYILRTVTIVLFVESPITPASTLLFAAAMGFLWLGVVPLVSDLIRRLFGLRYFNTLFGLAFFSHQVGAFLGAWLGGVIFDSTGSYAEAWMAMVVVGLGAGAVQWLMDDCPPRHDRLRGELAPLARAA